MRRHGGWMTTVIGVLSLCLVLSGCDFIRQRMEERFGTKVAPPQEVPATPQAMPPSAPVAPPLDAKMAVTPPLPPTQNPDQALIEELNGYVNCLNRTSPRTNDSRARYLSWVNEKTGPNCKEQYIMYGLYSLYDDGIEKCNKAAERGRSAEPSLPELEQAATELAAAYAELVPLVKKAEDYYQQQDYKDDQCAKAKEMHPKLMESFGRYRQAELKLQKGVDGLKGDVDRRELTRLEQERGRTLSWYSRNFSLSAKTLMQTMPTENPLLINSQSYLSAFTQVDKDYQAFIDYAAAHPEEGKGVFWYSAYESSAKSFITQAKFLKRDLAEGKKPETNALNNLIRNYNRLVSDANNVKF